MDYPTLMEFFKLLFEAPLNTVLVLSGILFLLLGIIPIHKISIKGISAGRISQQWRVVSAVAGACLIILGVALTIYTPPDVNQGTTPATSCLGAPQQRMQIGQQGRVCTAKDKVVLRESPSKSSKSLDRLSPGTYFAVEDGPVCSDNWSWWKVKVESGTVGWIAEGGDATDPYFICPLP